MAGEEDPWLDRDADDFGGGFPLAWQDWAMIGIFIGLLAAAQLFIPRSSLVYYPAFGAGAAVFLALYARKTRLGRRWLERLKAALSDQPEPRRRPGRPRR